MKKKHYFINLAVMSLGFLAIGDYGLFSANINAQPQSQSQSKTQVKIKMPKLPSVGAPTTTTGSGVRGPIEGMIEEKWGLTLVEDCQGSVAKIEIDKKIYCTQSTSNIPGGKYIYNRKNSELTLIELIKPNVINVDPNLEMIKSWGLKSVGCEVGNPVVSILIDNQQYCTEPNKDILSGNYVYNRSRNSLKRLFK